MPIFSLAHTTARLPNGWRRAYSEWMAKASHPENVEYVISVDAGSEIADVPAGVRVVVNDGPRTAVAGWNAAAAATTGQVIISVADDWFPPQGWDDALLAVLPSLDGEHVVEVSTGGDDGILTFSILTRAYYERIGGRLFHPEFVGMFADNDFTDQARGDGVVVDAKHLMFPHEHPVYGTGTWDSTYEHQRCNSAWEIGETVYRRRREERLAVNAKPHLFLATPCYGGMLTVPYAASLLRTAMLLTQQEGITVSPALLSGDSLVQRARNVLVAQFMASEATHLMFVDADISWNPRDISRLMQATERPEIEVCCGVYPKKSLPIDFVCNFHGAGVIPQIGEFIEVRDAPTGFLMIRRSAIARMMDAYPERRCSFRPDSPRHEEYYEYALFDCFIDPDSRFAPGQRQVRRYLSEDYGFTRLWQKIGGRIWAHPEIVLSHYGSYCYSGKLSDSLEKL